MSDPLKANMIVTSTRVKGQPDPTFVWTDPCKDVAEAIEHNERVFVHSSSGMGKSFLIRQIASLVKRPIHRVSLNGEIRLRRSTCLAMGL